MTKKENVWNEVLSHFQSLHVQNILCGIGWLSFHWRFELYRTQILKISLNQNVSFDALIFCAVYNNFSFRRLMFFLIFLHIRKCVESIRKLAKAWSFIRTWSKMLYEKLVEVTFILRVNNIIFYKPYIAVFLLTNMLLFVEY